MRTPVTITSFGVINQCPTGLMVTHLTRPHNQPITMPNPQNLKRGGQPVTPISGACKANGKKEITKLLKNKSYGWITSAPTKQIQPKAILVGSS